MRSYIPVLSPEWKETRLKEVKKEMDFGIRDITVTPKQCITKEKWESLRRTLILEISPNWNGKENESTEEVVVNC
ncbi:hypothetical protein TNCV_1475161 [Trichonephila clavipes]|nr:hypothetical protein TNCV_1475161 [Trichonephila clavipes]